jgi:hypothetical protein
MDRTTTFQEFLTTQSAYIPVGAFLLNLFIAACLAWILGKVYEKYGNVLSNRALFGRNFLIITLTTTLIISVVKSSLALSLGLVGALSIIRFRAAIKEPEELSYLFLAIAIGLGFGADQAQITLIAFAFVVVAVILLKQGRAKDPENLYLTVAGDRSDSLGVSSLVDVLDRHCVRLDLRRFDETPDRVEATFLVEFTNLDSLEAARTQLREVDASLRLTFLDVGRGALP